MRTTALDLIDLDQPLPGQRKFVTCWLARAEGLTFVVDPGPRSTAGYLVRSLRDLGVERLDWILLTHIHLDHAGGTAELGAAYPEARVVCHETGRAHLVDPARLWEGSRAVLGHIAEVYGEPAPVEARRLATAGDLTSEAFARTGIRIVPTPGHAPHHLSFVHDGTLFVGEAAGTYMALPDGPHGRVPFLRPATPPRFHLGVALDSLDRLLTLEPAPARMAFAHYGLVEGGVRELLRVARGQLESWVSILAEELEADRHDRGGTRASETAAERQAGGKPGARGIDDRLVARVHARLLQEDPHYARWPDLEPDIRERELVFTRQTLEGMLGFLENPPRG